MSADLPTDARAAGGGDHPADGSASRPSKNNRHGYSHPANEPDSEIGPSDVPNGAGLRPISVGDTSVRKEAAAVKTPEGYTVPLPSVEETPEGERRGRPWYRVLAEWRDWYDGYRNAHIEYESPDGETVRTRLENSYQPEYGKRYYAKLKDLERGIERRFDGVTTAMLTFTASHLNANDNPRCPADHMREIADGWDTARKQLHKVLDGRTWEYARVWEPHKDGYGHMHVAVFVLDDGAEIDREMFGPVMESYVGRCGPAGSEAHQVTGDDAAVSVNDDVENMGSYISEYIGIFGDETLERPMSEQAFYAVTWATNTRRLDFSNGAQDIISGEKFRRETGLRPEDRGKGGTESGGKAADGVEDGGDGETWAVDSICTVVSRRPTYSDPTTGGVETVRLDPRPEADPPPEVD